MYCSIHPARLVDEILAVVEQQLAERERVVELLGADEVPGAHDRGAALPQIRGCASR